MAKRSLLDMLIQREKRLPSGREFLDASMQERRAGGLLGPPSPSRPPSILNAQSSPSGPGGGGDVQMPAAAQPGGGGGLPANQPVQAGQAPQGQQAAPQQGGSQPAGSTSEAIVQARREQAPRRGREPGPGDDGLGFFGRLFTGSLTDRENRLLTADDKKRLRNNALINAGLAMLGGPQNASFAQTLARGVLAARQQTRNSRGALVNERIRQREIARLHNAIADPSLSEQEQWEKVREILVSQGKMDHLETVNSVLKEMRKRDETELDSTIKEVNGQKVQVVTKPDGSTEVRNLFTGEVLDEAPAPPENREEAQDRVNQLSDDYRQATGDLRNAIRQADTAATIPVEPETPDPAQDMTLVIALTKLRDPGSVVRPSEARATSDVANVAEQAEGLMNRIHEQGQLATGVRRKLKQEIVRLRQIRAQQLQQENQFWTNRAQAAGVNPDLVLRSVPALDQGGASGAGGGAGTGASLGGLGTGEDGDPFADLGGGGSQ